MKADAYKKRNYLQSLHRHGIELLLLVCHICARYVLTEDIEEVLDSPVVALYIALKLTNLHFSKLWGIGIAVKVSSTLSLEGLSNVVAVSNALSQNMLHCCIKLQGCHTHGAPSAPS